MYRIFRPGRLLASSLLLAIVAPAHSADFVIDAPLAVGAASPGATGGAAADFDAESPAVASAEGKFRTLVVWSADDASFFADTEEGEDKIRTAEDEFEINARLMVTSSLEFQTDKFRVSIMGDDFETVATERARYDAKNPAVAWNPIAEEFLVAWEADDDTASLVDDEFEIFAQRIDVTGKLVGDRIRISQMGDEGATDAVERARYGAARPSIAVNAVTGEYLVAWQGDDDAAPLVDNEIEIFGRILDADAVPVAPQFRISVVGDDTEASAAVRAQYDAVQARAVYNPVTDAYVVAWQADDDQFGLADDEHEVFLQRLDSTGNLLATPIRASQMGVDGDNAYQALAPALAVDPQSGTLLVGWHGDTPASPLVDDEFEIHGRLFDANVQALGSQFRLSTMGPDSETNSVERQAFEAKDADIAWSTQDEAFLVIWTGDQLSDPLVEDEFEIFGRFVKTDGTLPNSQFRISNQGDNEEEDPVERAAVDAVEPAISYADGNLVPVWSGDTDKSSGGNNHFQIFTRRVAERFTTLDLRITSFTPPVIPRPIRLPMTLTNTGEHTAENVRIRPTLGNEFPLTWEGCDSVDSDGLCQLGDVPADAVISIVLVLSTDHVKLGDTQGTTIVVTAITDTALSAPNLAGRTGFFGATLEVDGGAGATGMPLLALIFLGAVITRRKVFQK